MKNLELKTINGINYRKISQTEWIREDERGGGNNMGLKKGDKTPSGATYNPDTRAIYQIFFKEGVERIRCVGMRETPQYPVQR